MIANFFQSLSARRVDYLLISGQATVLYGAATFSEDIDLWVGPEAGNSERFLDTLRECRGRYYKLTPAFTPQNLQRGHGFHFVMLTGEGDVFLDVMGAPPRAGSFAEALRNARWMDSEWGSLHVVGIQTLVELKKTQRLEDYPIISRLALAWLEQPECGQTADDYRWALQNIFTIPELRVLFQEQPRALDLLGPGLPPSLAEFARQSGVGAEVPDDLTGLINLDMQRRMGELQQADRQYWRGIIAELRHLSAAGVLVPEGAAV
jgi:hypothetical protein